MARADRRPQRPVHDGDLAGRLDLLADVAADAPRLDPLAPASSLVHRHAFLLRGGLDPRRPPCPARRRRAVPARPRRPHGRGVCFLVERPGGHGGARGAGVERAGHHLRPHERKARCRRDRVGRGRRAPDQGDRLFAQPVLLHLARGGHGKRLGEADPARDLERGEVLLKVAPQLILPHRSAGLEADPGEDLLAQVPGRDSHDLRVGDSGMAARDRFDLGGIDVLAAADDHLLEASHDPDVAAGVARRQVAGVEPALAVDRRGRLLGHVEVALHHHRSAGPQLPGRPGREGGAGRRVGDPHLRSGDRASDAAEAQLGRVRRRGLGDDRGGLRQAVGDDEGAWRSRTISSARSTVTGAPATIPVRSDDRSVRGRSG